MIQNLTRGPAMDPMPRFTLPMPLGVRVALAYVLSAIPNYFRKE